MRLPPDRKLAVVENRSTLGGRRRETIVPEALHALPLERSFREALAVTNQLVNEGLVEQGISRVPRFPDDPRIIYYEIRGKEFSAGGADREDEGLALRKAISECIERKLWYEPTKEPHVRVMRLADTPRNTLPLSSLAGFSEADRARNLHLSYNPDTRLAFVPARSLFAPWRHVWCPLQLVSGAELAGMPHEPLLRHRTSNGLATSWRSSKEAAYRGLLEVIERDAFSIMYANSLSPKRITVESLARQDPAFAALAEEFRRARLSLTLALLPTDFPIAVVAAFVTDESGEGPAFAMGARADFSVLSASTAAAVEALMMRCRLRGSDFWKLPVTTRSSNMTQEERVRFWAQPENLGRLSFFFEGPEIKAPTEHEPPGWREGFGKLTAHLKSRGYHAYCYELPGIPTGIPLHTVMTVVPELQPINLLSALPYTSGARFKEVPEMTGYAPAATLNLFPHPFP